MSQETDAIRPYVEKADAIVHASECLQIHNQQEREMVATIALEARIIDDEAEAAEKKITRPLNEALREVRQLFKDGVRLKCDLAQTKADNLLKQDYLDEEDGRKNAQDITSRQTGVSIILPPTEKTIETRLGKVIMRKDIEVSIDDKMTIIRAIANNKLPLILAEIDTGAAKRYFKSADMKEAPGFIIRETVSVVGNKNK